MALGAVKFLRGRDQKPRRFVIGNRKLYFVKKHPNIIPSRPYLRDK
jgi:hypothetical protein